MKTKTGIVTLFIKTDEVMNSPANDKSILVLHNNSKMSSIVDEIMLCNEEGGRMPGVPTKCHADLVLEDCKAMGDHYVLICRDLKEEDKLRGAPTIIATSYHSERLLSEIESGNNSKQKPQDIHQMASVINSLLSVFGFAYLAINNQGRKKVIV